jgi:hypothetical protein
MAKKRKYSLRERAILLLGGAIKRKRRSALDPVWPRSKGPAPENKMLSIPENKIVRGEG